MLVLNDTTPRTLLAPPPAALFAGHAGWTIYIGIIRPVINVEHCADDGDISPHCFGASQKEACNSIATSGNNYQHLANHLCYFRIRRIGR